MEFVTIATAAIALLEKLIPKIAELARSGDVTVEEQQQLADRFNSLKNQIEGGFTGPEWEQSGR